LHARKSSYPVAEEFVEILVTCLVSTLISEPVSAEHWLVWLIGFGLIQAFKKFHGRAR